MYFALAKYSRSVMGFCTSAIFSSKELDAEGSEVSISRISAPTVLRMGRIVFGFTFCGSK